jgi:hypothetical protein
VPRYKNSAFAPIVIITLVDILAENSQRRRPSTYQEMPNCAILKFPSLPAMSYSRSMSYGTLTNLMSWLLNRIHYFRTKTFGQTNMTCLDSLRDLEIGPLMYVPSFLGSVTS